MNNRIDLLEGNIFTSLTKLAIPIMATSFIQMAYNMVDMIWIGKLGSGSVAAIGVVGMYIWLSNGFTTLARMGGQVKVAHTFGAKRYEDARAFAKNSLQLCFILGLLYSMTMLLFTKPLIGFFKLTDAKVVYDANVYLRIVSVGLIFTFLNQGMTGIITATGNSKTPFMANTVGLIINIILDPILIFGFDKIPPMGVAGAAIATVIAQMIVFIIYILYARNDDLLFIEIKIFSKPNIRYMSTIVKLGLPVAIQGAFFTAVTMFISRMVANWGDVAIAVQKVGSQIESISWMTAEGFASATNSFIGQNYGANNYERAKKGYTTSLLIMIVWGIISTAILIFMPKALFTIFINEAKAIPYGIDYLIILGYSQLPMCVEIITAGAFAGFGKTIYPSVVSIILTGIRLPLAAILVYMGLGLNGIWWSITISSILKGIILIIIFIIFINKKNKENTILFEN